MNAVVYVVQKVTQEGEANGRILGVFMDPWMAMGTAMNTKDRDAIHVPSVLGDYVPANEDYEHGSLDHLSDALSQGCSICVWLAPQSDPDNFCMGEIKITPVEVEDMAAPMVRNIQVHVPYFFRGESSQPLGAFCDITSARRAIYSHSVWNGSRIERGQDARWYGAAEVFENPSDEWSPIAVIVSTVVRY